MKYIEVSDAIETTWMVLRGLGYRKEENPKLEQTVCEVFATAPSAEQVRIMEEPHRPTLKKPKVSAVTWVCPECGRDVEFQTMRVGALLFHNRQDFCPNCGQAIDWEDE